MSSLQMVIFLLDTRSMVPVSMTMPRASAYSMASMGSLSPPRKLRYSE